MSNGSPQGFEAATYELGVYVPVMKSPCVCMLETLWNGAHQAPLSMGFSRQDYWSELPFSPSGDLSNPGTEHRSPALQADSLPSEPLAFQVDQW